MVEENEFQIMKKKFIKLKAKKESLEFNIEELKRVREKAIRLNQDQIAARTIFQKIAQATQDNLKFEISNLVTFAIHSIFNNDISFEMAIEQRRNKTEIDFYVNEFGNLQEPLDSSGHGLVDIISLALRISYWSLKKNRKTFLLDEPFRNLSSDHSQAASRMLKMLCDKLDLQIIIVSHDKEITDYADRVFHVSKTDKKSLVSLIHYDERIL